MIHWHLSPYTMIREKRDGIQGLQCDRCRYWVPVIARSESERASMRVLAPAHERYIVLQIKRWAKLWRSA